MRFKKFAHLLVLVFFIMLSTIVPFPVTFKRKDKTPTYTIEQIDKKEDDEEETYLFDVS